MKTARPATPVPNILIVCTGNICRSPLTEQVLRARLIAAGISATVSSAGTHAVVGGTMTPEAGALARQLGAASTEHTPRQLNAHLLAEADLVLTATRDHRREVVTLFPPATRYTFTLNQFARLIAAAEPGSLGAGADESPSALPPTMVAPLAPRSAPVATESASASPSAAGALATFAAFVAEIAATRGLQPSPTPPTLDDIEDPYRRSAAVYSRVAAIIDRSVSTLVAAMSHVLATR